MQCSLNCSPQFGKLEKLTNYIHYALKQKVRWKSQGSVLSKEKEYKFVSFELCIDHSKSWEMANPRWEFPSPKNPYMATPVPKLSTTGIFPDSGVRRNKFRGGFKVMAGLVGGRRKIFDNLQKNFLRKLQKMNYFSIFSKKFNKPCVNF